MPRATAAALLLARPWPTPRDVERAARERALAPRDARLLARIVDAHVRRQASLRVLLDAFLEGKPNRAVQRHVSVGLVQLFFLDGVPDHAAVAETVEATKSELGPKKAQYVNGVLRAALRARVQGTSGDARRDLPGRDVHLEKPLFHDPRQHPLLWLEEAWNVPVALAKRWTKRYGPERTLELARASLARPRALERRLDLDPQGDEAAGVEGPRRTAATTSVERVAHPLGAHPNGAATRATLAGSVTALVGANSGERGLVWGADGLRACTELSAAGAHLVVEPITASERRAAQIGAFLARTGATERVELRTTGAHESDTFDFVLLHAPNSRTAVLGERPHARWTFSSDAQRALGELQTRLLRDAATRTRPGGRLVYATRSVEPEENQRRVRAFLLEHADFALERELEALPELDPEHGLRPGGYAARLVRNA